MDERKPLRRICSSSKKSARSALDSRMTPSSDSTHSRVSMGSESVGILDPAQIIPGVGIQRGPTCNLKLGTLFIGKRSCLCFAVDCRVGRRTPVSLKSILRISSTDLESPAQATYASA